MTVVEGRRRLGGQRHRGAGQRSDAVSDHDGQEAVVGGGPRHVDDRVEFEKVWIPVQVDDRGERLEGRRLDLHQVVAPHLQDVHQLLQQAGVKEGLDKKTAFWRDCKYYYFAIIPGSSLSVGCCR